MKISGEGVPSDIASSALGDSECQYRGGGAEPISAFSSATVYRIMYDIMKSLLFSLVH